MAIDLNADLGEGGPDDPALLSVVTSTSVACGVHAGTPVTMMATVRAALEGGAILGAHPSYDDREGFGRRDLDVAEDTISDTVACQTAALCAVASLAGGRVGFVKPHGSLYNRAARDPVTARAVLDGITRAGVGAVLAPPGSALHRLAADAGLDAYGEVFADRAYLADGTLVPRARDGAVITDASRVGARAVRMARDREVEAVDGSVLPVRADSICVHGDTPGALALARAVRAALEVAGVEVRPFLRPV